MMREAAGPAPGRSRSSTPKGGPKEGNDSENPNQGVSPPVGTKRKKKKIKTTTTLPVVEHKSAAQKQKMQ